MVVFLFCWSAFFFPVRIPVNKFSVFSYFCLRNNKHVFIAKRLDLQLLSVIFFHAVLRKRKQFVSADNIINRSVAGKSLATRENIGSYFIFCKGIYDAHISIVCFILPTYQCFFFCYVIGVSVIIWQTCFRVVNSTHGKTGKSFYLRGICRPGKFIASVFRSKKANSLSELYRLHITICHKVSNGFICSAASRLLSVFIKSRCTGRVTIIGKSSLVCFREIVGLEHFKLFFKPGVFTIHRAVSRKIGTCAHRKQPCNISRLCV